MFKLEDNVALPDSNPQPARYPLADMKVGQSFFVALEGAEQEKVLRRMRGACTYAQRRSQGRRYTARPVDGGVRVWRLEDDPNYKPEKAGDAMQDLGSLG